MHAHGKNSEHIQHDHGAQQICAIKNDAHSECPAMIVPGRHAEKQQQNYPCRPGHAEQENVAVEQVTSLDVQEIDCADINDEWQPEDKHSAAQAGENGRHKKVERVGLDVAAQLIAARFVRRLVFLVCAARADIEGLHRA